MKVWKILFIFILGVFQHGLAIGAAGAYGLNDVSIMIPLPDSVSTLENLALKAESKISDGYLLPRKLLTKLNLGDFVPTNKIWDTDNYKNLDVIGLRVDPCFRDHFSDSCTPQIRLILQSYQGRPTGNRSNADAVHVFYKIDLDKLKSIMAEMRSYRANFFSDDDYLYRPLSVNPLLEKEGLAGEYFALIKRLVTENLKKENLIRVALFLSANDDTKWLFRSFDFKNGQAHPVAIPDTQSNFLILENKDPQSKQFLQQSNSLPAAKEGTDQLFDYLRNSEGFLKSKDENALSKLSLSLEKINNPTKHLPGTIDCVSCHAAPAVENSLGIDANDRNRAFSFVSIPADALSNGTAKDVDTTFFRMFTYHLKKPVIAQRVIYESASIADYLNQN